MSKSGANKTSSIELKNLHKFQLCSIQPFYARTGLPLQKVPEMLLFLVQWNTTEKSSSGHRLSQKKALFIACLQGHSSAYSLTKTRKNYSFNFFGRIRKNLKVVSYAQENETSTQHLRIHLNCLRILVSGCGFVPGFLLSKHAADRAK